MTESRPAYLLDRARASRPVPLTPDPKVRLAFWYGELAELRAEETRIQHQIALETARLAATDAGRGARLLKVAEGGYLPRALSRVTYRGSAWGPVSRPVATSAK